MYKYTVYKIRRKDNGHYFCGGGYGYFTEEGGMEYDNVRAAKCGIAWIKKDFDYRRNWQIPPLPFDVEIIEVTHSVEEGNIIHQESIK